MEENIKTKILPLIPLRGKVLLPKTLLSVDVGRPVSVKAVETSVEFNNLLFISAQKNAFIDAPTKKDICEVGVIAEVKQIIKLPNGNIKLNVSAISRAKILSFLDTKDYFCVKVEEVPEEVTREFEKAIFLRVIDTYWMEHINTMSILREGIHLRGYANENPLRAYTNEGFELFENLLMNIDKDVTMFIIKAEVRHNTERKQVAKPIDNVDTSKTGKKKPKTVKKVGRNEKCPCGSGKKYKMCCGK